MNTVAVVCLVLAAIPLLLVLANLALFRAPEAGVPASSAMVSILIPARDEAHQIEAACHAALASEGVELEVIVLDDGSTDGTAQIVEQLANADPRLRVISGPGLPAGWVGKVHACWNLAQAARGDWLLFVDADVLLAADAAARLVSYAQARSVDLLSGIPKQKTETLGEKLIVPLIHHVLLGYLPLIGARLSSHPAFAAGVGQLLFTRAEAYREVGGHAEVKSQIQDGIALPRWFRQRSKRTDLVDITPLATCRMYGDFASVWHGFAKNAHAGMGSPVAIWVWTILLGGGHVLPWFLWVPAWLAGSSAASVLAAAMALSMLSRILLTLRFGQSWLGALLHPLGMLLIIAIQWYGLTRWLVQKPVTWKGREPV